MDIILTSCIAAVVASTAISIDTHIQKKQESKVLPAHINHSRRELVKNYAGEFIPNPEELKNGTEVTVYQKGTEGYWEESGFGWWEHGEICTEHGVKKINCYDGTYELNEVEVYTRKYYG